MKAVKGYDKKYYMENNYTKEFETIDQAAEYLSCKYGHSKAYMIESIIDDTNCDAVYFDDGSVLLFELQ